MEVIASIKDQPERRKVNGLMLGNSNGGARRGYSCFLKSHIDTLPCCDSCVEKLMKNKQLSECNKCLQWDTNRIPGWFKLTSKRLKECVESIHTNVEERL